MENNKSKNIELPPSGLPDDLSTLGTSSAQSLARSSSRSEPMPLWKKFLGVCVVVLLLAFLGALTPKDGQPSNIQIYATETAVRVTMTAKALIKGDARPTSTITPTLLSDSITDIAPKVFYTQSTTNVRECTQLSCLVVATVKKGEEITVDGSLEGEIVRSNRIWYRVKVGEIVGYISSNLVDITPPRAAATIAVPTQDLASITTIPQSLPTSSSDFTCPTNCDGAVSMGLSPAQAASCPGLDRDKDGVACYGD